MTDVSAVNHPQRAQSHAPSSVMFCLTHQAGWCKGAGITDASAAKIAQRAQSHALLSVCFLYALQAVCCAGAGTANASAADTAQRVQSHGQATTSAASPHPAAQSLTDTLQNMMLGKRSSSPRSSSKPRLLLYVRTQKA